MIETINPIKSSETIEKDGDPILIERGLKRRKLLKSNSIYNEDNFKESLYFQDKYDKVYDRVVSILRQYPETRKFDWQLLIFYWSKMGMIKILVPMDKLNQITPPESITRQKRKAIENAKKGNLEVNFLLKDNNNLSIRNEHEDLYNKYYQFKKTSNMINEIK